MSILQYNNINLSVNNSYILAESITVSESNTPKPIYSFNNNIPFDNTPTTLKGQISISYYLKPDNGIWTPIYNNALDNQLVALSWQIPCPSFSIGFPTPDPANQVLTLQGAPDILYSVNLLFRGIIENALYSGGIIIPNTSSLMRSGCSYIPDGHNIYALIISNPSQVYYLNNAYPAESGSTLIARYSTTVNINGGSTMILSGSTVNGGEAPNANQLSINALPGEPPIIPIVQPFTGQFLQMDATGSSHGILYTNEPNFSILTELINDTTISEPSIINIGQIYITGYLNNLDLQLSPNGLIKSTCSFDVFYPFTGNLSKQLSTDPVLYDTLNSSGLAHYWAAQFYSGSNIISDNNILQLSYSAQIGITPIYGIGSPYPKQIYTNGITESLDVLTENQFNINYTGANINQIRPDLQILTFSGISSTGTITIPMSGFLLKDSKFDVSLDNIILYNNSYTRSR